MAKAKKTLDGMRYWGMDMGTVFPEAAVSRLDYTLLGVVLVLLVLGLQMVYSSSLGFALSQYNDATYLVVKQGMWAVAGGVLLLIAMKVDYHRWRTYSVLGMFMALGILVLIFIPGIGVSFYGASRWLKLGPLPPFQPSEFVKLATILYVSVWLVGRGERLKDLSAGLVPFVLMVGLVGGLILLQPDMGTAILIVLVTCTLFFTAGASLRHVLILAAVGIVAGVALTIGVEYRHTRFEAFLDPWKDPKGYGFQIIQSLVAFGSGGLGGIGLGASRQKFFYIPAPHTDAIFAIIGEELGFIGSMIVMVLFAALAYKGFRIALKAPDDLGKLFATGITCLLIFQALINIGGITKSIPFTGITLPFISYGGSSLAISMASIGILLNIAKHSSGDTVRERRKRRI
ncbi:MAG: putative lipid II flippase FtsW [Chloroflexi bacterium]|nr:putative lipid II flippase FtsW [Chloroflexota bacterium]